MTFETEQNSMLNFDQMMHRLCNSTFTTDLLYDHYIPVLTLITLLQCNSCGV